MCLEEGNIEDDVCIHCLLCLVSGEDLHFENWAMMVCADRWVDDWHIIAVDGDMGDDNYCVAEQSFVEYNDNYLILVENGGLDW